MSTEVLSSAVVVIGNFNPVMFHPTWFRGLELFGAMETEAAISSGKVVISPAQTMFSIGGFDVHIVEDRMQIGTAREDLHEPLFDLMVSLLNILDVTPVSAVGINWSSHIRANSTSQWHAFGDRFAPKDFWKTHWGTHAGMLNTSIQLGRKDDRSGNVNVTVTPSPNIIPGVYVRVNDHFDVKEGQALKAGDLLKEVWRDSKNYSATLIGEIKKDLLNG